MKKITLFELTSLKWDQRWTALKEALIPHKIDLDFQFVEVSEKTQLESEFKRVMNLKPDIFIITNDWASEIMPLITHTNQEADLFGAADLFLKTDGVMWPRTLSDEAFIRSFTSHFKQIDLMAPALIAGIGPLTRFVVPALAHIGIKKISIADSDEEQGIKLIEQFKKKFFNIKFEFVKFETITTLPGVYALLVNTTALNLENHLLDELYFFNFLKNDGAVVDLTLIPPLTPLLTEAQEWGARLMSGETYYSQHDCLMIEKVTGIKLDEAKYCAALRTLANNVSFDLQPYLKRFLDRI